MLLCPCCKYERVNTSAFLNISLEVSAADAGDSPLMDESSSVRNQSVDLNVLLENHMKTEILDTDNKWQCSGCNDRVQALKYHEYKALPSSLMVHLKRFHYNTVSVMHKKY